MFSIFPSPYASLQSSVTKAMWRKHRAETAGLGPLISLLCTVLHLQTFQIVTQDTLNVVCAVF